MEPGARTSVYLHAISSVLGLREDNYKIHVLDIPAKKEKTVRELVLPAEVRDVPILAVVDLTVFANSAKDCLVFTSSHCYGRSLGERKSFRLCDLTGILRFGRITHQITVELGDARLTIDASPYGRLIRELFEELIRVNRRAMDANHLTP